MSAADVMRLAADLGIEISEVGKGRLRIAGKARPPPAVLSIIAEHKPGLLMLLQPGRRGWQPDDWRAYYDERAGANDLLYGLSPDQAATRAFACCVAAWIDDHNLGSASGLCAQCGGADAANDALQAYGVAADRITHVHRRCWPEWYRKLKQDAAAALIAMGVPSPPEEDNER